MFKKAAKAVKGTFLEKVFGFMEKGNFAEVDSPKELDGEEKRGDMTLFEKGLYSYLKYAQAREHELVNFFRGKSLIEIEAAKLKAQRDELEVVRDGFEAANKLLWDSIRTRVSDDNIGIRSGFEIVKLSETKDDPDDCNCPFCQIRRSLESRVAGSKSTN
jgi:hypothetical protein